MVGLMVYIQYKLMAGVGHGAMAIALDASVVGLYGLLRLFSLLLTSVHSWKVIPRTRTYIAGEIRNPHQFGNFAHH
jgi:hypothetical protein